MIESIANTLTWVLIHSLWIALLIWLITSSIAGNLNRPAAKSSTRVIGLLSFIGAMLAVFTYLLSGLPGSFPTTSEATSVIPDISTKTSILLPTIEDWIASNSLTISGIWLIGILIGFIKFVMNKRTLANYKSSAIACQDDSLISQVQGIKIRLGISRKVKLMVSSLINSPMTIGVIRPVIYVPIGMTTGFSFQEIETLLYHEMLHIKRYDYLVALMLAGLETLFFFNPIILLMIRETRKEMEYACDEGVLQKCEQSPYLTALLRLQEINVPPRIILAAKTRNSEFRKRIELIINKREMNNRKKGIRGLMPQIVALMIVSSLIGSAFISKPEKVMDSENEIRTQDQKTAQKKDTINAKNVGELKTQIQELSTDQLKNTVILTDGKQKVIIRPVNNALEKADKMMKEIQQELIDDGLLNEGRKKITLMFQYSDVLNGKAALGEKYEKYKGILNKYFPVYDSFATTRVFRFK